MGEDTIWIPRHGEIPKPNGIAHSLIGAHEAFTAASGAVDITISDSIPSDETAIETLVITRHGDKHTPGDKEPGKLGDDLRKSALEVIGGDLTAKSNSISSFENTCIADIITRHGEWPVAGGAHYMESGAHNDIPIGLDANGRDLTTSRNSIAPLRNTYTADIITRPGEHAETGGAVHHESGSHEDTTSLTVDCNGRDLTAMSNSMARDETKELHKWHTRDGLAPEPGS